MPRALVLTSQLDRFAGAQVVSMEVAEHFCRMGYSTVLLCNSFSDTVARSIKGDVRITTELHDIRISDYDVIWSQHNMISLFARGIHVNEIRGDILSVHLSPFGRVDRVGIASGCALGARFIANSLETLIYLRKAGVPAAKISNMKNAAPDAFYRSDVRPTGDLKHLSIVSNHVPPEVTSAAKKLQKCGVKVSILGKDFESGKRVTEQDIFETDAVITIGKTTQYCVMAGVPVFCYDKFGGPGWLTEENFQSAEDFNFSGRCCNEKMSDRRIFDEIRQGFSKASEFATKLSREKHSEYSLPRFINDTLGELTRHSEATVNASAVLESSHAIAEMERWRYHGKAKRHRLMRRAMANFSDLIRIGQGKAR